MKPEGEWNIFRIAARSLQLLPMSLIGVGRPLREISTANYSSAADANSMKLISKLFFIIPAAAFAWWVTNHPKRFKKLLPKQAKRMTTRLKSKVRRGSTLVSKSLTAMRHKVAEHRNGHKV